MHQPPLASADELRDTLAHWQHERGARYCTALIDVSRHMDAAACADALQLDLKAFEALPNVYEKFAPTLKGRGPRLYTALPTAEHWPGIFASAVNQRTTSFILHDCTPGKVLAHLQSLVRLEQPDRNKRLFRFQDSTVLSMLIPLLTVRQLHSLLGPMRGWLVLDVCAHPVIAAKDSKSDGHSFMTLKFDRQQLDALDARLRPASIIAQANEVDSALLHGKTRCEQWRLVQSAIQCAVDHGLDLKEDVALFCILSLQLPVNFDQTGPVAAALQRSRREGVTFSRAIDQVPVEEWRAWDEQLDAVEAPL